jgi:hypothetical protein
MVTEDHPSIIRKNKKKTHKDSRTWKNRLQALHKSWKDIFDGLVSAYVSWRRPDGQPTASSPWDFTIEVIDIYTLSTQALIKRNVDCDSVSKALVLNGYLGTTPQNPSTAVSFKTLELYYKIRRRKPSFSIEGFAKVVCDLYMVSRRAYRRHVY